MRDRCKIGEFMAKNWSIDVVLDQARNIALPEEMRDLNQFFDCLRSKDYFETQPRFCPKKLLNIFRLYQMINDLEYKEVSLKLGYTFASNDYYARKLGVGNRAVQTYLTELEKLELIEREVLTNICQQGDFHSFRKLSTRVVTQEQVKKVNKTIKVKIVFKNTRNLLPTKKERFYYFTDLYRKFEKEHDSAWKDSYENPYFLDYFHPFGFTKRTLLKCSTNKSAKELKGNLSVLAYMYPLVKGKDKVKWLTFPNYY